MIAIDLVCESCGEANPPGTEFCRNCNAFLVWDESAAPTRTSAAQRTTVQQPVVPVQSDPAPTAPTTPDAPTGSTEPIAYDDAQPVYADLNCPSCGTVNAPGRRFCAHCGYSFVAEYGTDPDVDWSGWSPQAIAARDREARKAYRRSLPPLYRWRRVIIGVVVFALFVGIGALLRRDPVALAKDTWNGLTKTYVDVGGVQARVEPAEASAPGSDPSALVDGTVQEWTMTWQPTAESTCGAAAGTGTVVFTFPATRVRQVLIYPGLDEGNQQRDLQPQPAQLGLTFPDGTCVPVNLGQGPGQKRVDLDSGVPITELRLGIGSAHPAGADARPLISLTEVIIKTFPS